MSNLEDEQAEHEIQCPKCGATDWNCLDERTFDCWDSAGNWSGERIVGYLACRVCGTQWTDVVVKSGEDCDCDE